MFYQILSVYLGESVLQSQVLVFALPCWLTSAILPLWGIKQARSRPHPTLPPLARQATSLFTAFKNQKCRFFQFEKCGQKRCCLADRGMLSGEWAKQNELFIDIPTLTRCSGLVETLLILYPTTAGWLTSAIT